jgi:hypothetical protein
MSDKYELKFKKQFPFIYIIKRPETNIERIHRQYLELINLFPIIIMIDGFVKIIKKVKKYEN